MAFIFFLPLLPFKKFALTGDVAAVALREDVFALSLNGLSCNDLAPNCCLDRDIKHLPRINSFSFSHIRRPLLIGTFSVHNR